MAFGGGNQFFNQPIQGQGGGFANLLSGAGINMAQGAVNGLDPFGNPNFIGQPAQAGGQGNQGNAAQIFAMMANAQQGLPNMMMANQANAYNQFPAQMQQGANQMWSVNQANQNASLNLAQLKAQEDMARMNAVAGLDKTMLNRPLYAGLIGGLTGAMNTGLGGGLLGFSNTNGPQSASMPASTLGNQQPNSFSGANLFNSIMGDNPWSPIGQSGNATGFNPLTALSDPADVVRHQQNINAHAALNYNQNQMPGGNPNIVSLGSVY